MRKSAVAHEVGGNGVAPSKVTRTFSLDMDVLQELAKIAQRRGITVSRLLNEILKSAIGRERDK